MIGPSWVLFTVMGQRVYPVQLHGADPQRGMMLGMSLLLGARGIGALVGPLVSARLAGNSDARLRLGILFGYLLVAAGYAAIGGAPNAWLACLCVIVAHSGGSTVWVFSTTLLQLHTEDRFRGRVFAADLALSMLTIAVGAYVCGRFLDWGFSPRTVATATGVIMLVPAVLWAWSMRKWQNQSVEVKNFT
jgi:predicted MFS family arabinose efflux permease